MTLVVVLLGMMVGVAWLIPDDKQKEPIVDLEQESNPFKE